MSESRKITRSEYPTRGVLRIEVRRGDKVFRNQVKGWNASRDQACRDLLNRWADELPQGA